MSTEKSQSAAAIEEIGPINIDEIGDGAAITAQGFLVHALDQASEELDRYDATDKRNIPPLAGPVVIAQAVVYLAERINDGCAHIAISLNNIARQLATAKETADPTASKATHDEC